MERVRSRIYHVNQSRPSMREASEKRVSACRRILARGRSRPAAIRVRPERLRLAVQSNRADEVRFFLQRGADPNVRNSYEESPLHIAAREGASEAMIALLKGGGDARALNCVSFTPLMIHLTRESPLSAEASAMLRQMDNGFSDCLVELRLIGHRFSLKGPLFESFSARIAVPSLAARLEELAARDTNRSSLLAMSRALQDAISPTRTVDDCAERIQLGEMVVVISGWYRHATCTVFCDGWVATANRGGYYHRSPGIAIQKVGNYLELESVIERLMRPIRGNSPEVRKQMLADVTHFEKGMWELLETGVPIHLPLKGQSTGNCGWVAAKLAVKLMLLFRKWNEVSVRSWEEIHKMIEPEYKAIIAYDRLHSLRGLEQLAEIPEMRAVTSFEELFGQLESACSKGGREEMREVVVKGQAALGRYNRVTTPCLGRG